MDFLSLYNFSIFILVLPLAGLGFVAIKYSRSSGARLIACVLFLLCAAYTFLIPLEFTSYSKPATMEWYSRHVEEAQVLWGMIDEDTMEVTLLLHWEGQGAPRLYKITNFENEEQKMEFAQDLQDAMQESEESQERGGTGEITLQFPFMDVEERKAQAESENPGEEQSQEGLEDIPGFGIEQEDDSPFRVEPPPLPNPEKTVIPWDNSGAAEWDGF